MDEETNEEGPRSFARLLEQLADGAAHAELSSEFHGLVQMLKDEAQARRGKVAGELSLKLSLKAEGDMVTIDYKITRKDPEPVRPSGAMWFTKGGNLTPTNPKQMGLPLREVKGSNADVRGIDDSRDTKEV